MVSIPTPFFHGRLLQQYPMPRVGSADNTIVLTHSKPSWDSMFSLMDLCSGFGGLSQGAMAAGWEIAVAVDHNPKMTGLFTKVCNAPTICGDFGDIEILHEIWKCSKGARAISSGFSCQPFSRLGDGKSHADDRSSCLPKTLAAAYYLQAWIVVLECVSPAGTDAYVRSELDKFVQGTNFTCSQVNLKLDHVWPCRRHRTRWLLTSPQLGPVDLHEWSPLQNISQVQQIIPEIHLWDVEDEQALSLDPRELAAFGVDDDSHGKHLLNAKGIAPCALHAWGNQLRPCACGCRVYPLSEARLQSKGLHGCLVRSATLPNGGTCIRHLHPNEAMCLNSMDPVLDFGGDVRLTLSAVGQIAAPLQALWIFGTLRSRLDTLMHASAKFDANAQIQAYRSWILMRARQVWTPVHEQVQDDRLLSMVSFWKDLKDLSLAELLYPLKWQGHLNEPISVAAVLDHLIRQSTTHLSTAIDVSPADIEEDVPTPWMDSPFIADDDTTAGCLCVDSCSIVF